MKNIECNVWTAQVASNVLQFCVFSWNAGGCFWLCAGCGCVEFCGRGSFGLVDTERRRSVRDLWKGSGSVIIGIVNDCLTLVRCQVNVNYLPIVVLLQLRFWHVRTSRCGCLTVACARHDWHIEILESLEAVHCEYWMRRGRNS